MKMEKITGIEVNLKIKLNMIKNKVNQRAEGAGPKFYASSRRSGSLHSIHCFLKWELG